MDPDACLRQIVEAADDGDEELLAESIHNLIEWMQKGGFHPTCTTLGAVNGVPRIEIISGRYQLINLDSSVDGGRHVVRCWANDVNENPNRIIMERSLY